ncbi:coproporphyrinogen dehydrogenase HemZ, partial [Lawsonibacter sp. DFI.6.74]|nr:coproporphyrinogen dehydrogenase HemZ [Lawsonibacter sp. DFI.6.74]
INLSMEYAKSMGLNPYYMYRQKHMLGNLENIGYAKEGFECIYNIQIMEEKQSNLAVGAGAISKYVYVDEDRIERTDNVKNVEIYIDRVD